MDQRRRRRLPSYILMRNIVIISSVASSVINLTVLAVSASTGKWLFGPLVCQLYGLFGQVLVSGGAWMVALAALERCYYVLAPTDHPATFSSTNVKVIVFGIYLMLMVLHTSPLYGWGEYSFHRGGLRLYIGMSDEVANNFTQTTTFNRFILTDDKSSNASIFTGIENDNCSKASRGNENLAFTPPNVAKAMQAFLEDEFGCESRTSMGTALVIILRFSEKASLQLFHTYFYGGVLTRKLHTHLVRQFSYCNSTLPAVQFEFGLHDVELRHYNDVHIIFQDLGICTLDFSTINLTITSWIPFAVFIHVAPYLLALGCGCVLRKLTSSGKRGLNPKADFFILCSVSGFMCIVPYYYVNCQNHLGNYISHVANLSATILFFASSLSYIFTCLCFGCCLNFAFVDLHTREEFSESDDNSNNVRRKMYRKGGTDMSDNSEMSNSML